MPRIKRGVFAKKKHRKLKKQTKGYLHSRRASVKKAREAILKAGQHAYYDRKKKKSNFRKLWIIKINAGLRNNGLTYSKFINLMHNKNIELDRKVLANLAEHEPEVFKEIVEEIKK